MQPTIAILGAGAGGLGAAVHLKRAGLHDFTIYEKSDGVGGTWRDNTYPGAACDVPSHLYSFSFAPNPHWTRTFATQPEILRYLEAVTDVFGLRSHLRLGTAITSARWSDDDRRWHLQSLDGEPFVADIVISALGMLNVPLIPEIPGRERFVGPQFHSSRWDHDVDLTNKTVAVVGTGASAIQFVPAIASTVGRLELFQRTPTWIRPKIDPEISPEERTRFRTHRWAAKTNRWKIWWTYERSNTRELDAPQTAQMTEFARSYLERKVPDDALRAALTPDHPLGCKRPLISRDWYPALTRPNVDVVTTPIVEITDTGLVTADGREYPVDVVIYGTGFRANEYLSALDVYGREGRRLHDDWKDGAEAYLGTTIAGYPNFFTMYGPNTNGVNSILFIHEAQARYITQAIRLLHRVGKREIEVRRSTMRRYNRRIQSQLASTVWTACNNYFTGPSGKIVTQMPFSGGLFWLRTRLLRPWNYVIR